jgi:hypothetical protein
MEKLKEQMVKQWLTKPRDENAWWSITTNFFTGDVLIEEQESMEEPDSSFIALERQLEDNELLYHSKRKCVLYDPTCIYSEEEIRELFNNEIERVLKII